MDCNSYSYAPHMLDESTPHYRPCNRVSIERRTANGHEYFVILDDTNDGSGKAYDLQTAIRTAANWLKEGV